MSNINDVYAIILGDGCVNKRGGIQLKHSMEQVEWLNYKVHVLQSNGFKVRIYETSEMSYGKIRSFINAVTTNTTFGKEMRKLFYPSDKKIVPSNIVESFNFHQWAILYQDDGRQNKISHTSNLINKIRQRVDTVPFVNRYELSKDNLDIASIELLCNSLSQLNIQTKIYYRKNNKLPIICITRAESKNNFYKGIKPFIIPSMEYKISAIPSLGYCAVRDLASETFNTEEYTYAKVQRTN